MTGWQTPYPHDYFELLDLAEREDVGTGDLTSALFGPEDGFEGYIESQAPGIACGIGLAAEILIEAGEVEVLVEDGKRVKEGTKVLTFAGQAGEVLARERLALNFLMQLSGVSTHTRAFVDAVKGTKAKIIDTRKTVPGMRALQKYAVRVGGGTNHRMGLYDAAMLKDNHIAAAGSIREAVKKVRASLPITSKIEVECVNLEMVREAIEAGADIVMLDNMSPAKMAKIVAEVGGRVPLEASGGITLETVREVAESGVDYISVGALTHSSASLPFHLEVSL